MKLINILMAISLIRQSKKCRANKINNCARDDIQEEDDYYHTEFQDDADRMREELIDDLLWDAFDD